MTSVFEFLSGSGAKRTDSQKASGTPSGAAGGISSTGSQDSSPTTPSGPAASFGSSTLGDILRMDASEGKSFRTAAMSHLEEVLTRQALKWSAMLEDPKVDAKTQIEMFKLASEHLARMRKVSDDSDERTKDQVGIEVLKEIMEGTAEKALRRNLPDMLDEERVLTAPIHRTTGGRPTKREEVRKERLAEVLDPLKAKQAQRTRKPTIEQDDSHLQRLLRKG